MEISGNNLSIVLGTAQASRLTSLVANLRFLLSQRGRAPNWLKAILLLAFLGATLTTPAIVMAAGSLQWTAKLIGNGVPVLGPFATKEQAVQALAAAIVQECTSIGYSCPDVPTFLQPYGDAAMTPNSKTYIYLASTPSTPTAYSCYSWSNDPASSNYQLILGSSGCYASEASAVAAMTSTAGCFLTPHFSQNVSLTPAGDWSPLLANASAVIIEGSSKVYGVYQQNPLLQNNCATTFALNELLWRTRGATCPEDFTPNTGTGGYPQLVPGGTDTLCTGPFAGTVTNNQTLDCPANAGPSTLIGDPCDVATGDFTQMEPDYSAAGLNFIRTYHSLTLESRMGIGWTHNYASHLVIAAGVPGGLVRSDGHDDALVASGSGVYISLSGAGIHVATSGSQWIAYLKDGAKEVYSGTGQLQEIIAPSGLITTLAYNSSGQLSSVSDAFGHSLQFGYNAKNQISTVTESDGSSIVYGYDSHNNLTTVTYPDNSVRTYQYTNSTFPNNLTGILDEQNQQYLTVTYDPTTAAVKSSYQGGTGLEAQLVSLTYSANGAVATDALAAIHTYAFTNSPGYSPRASSLVVNGQTQSYVVAPPTTDVQQRVTQYTDANNNITTYAYDSNHLTSKTEAHGTSIARTTTYSTYQDTLTSLPTLVVEPLRRTAYSYNSGSYQLHTKTITDTTVTPNVSRIWTYTYTASGQVQTVDGPRTDVSDVTTYSYYTCTTGTQCGQIETITNAVGQVTTFNTYNAHAQPLTITDPNGVVTTLTYDSRQRVKSREVGTETTSYSYYPTGLLETVTLPDSSTVQYTYDGAHRLTDITDGLGDHTHYTLDAMGNRIATKIYDPSNTLRGTHTRVINALNELYQDITAADTAAVTTTFGYDSNGNQTSSDAPLSRNTVNQYDPLNRLEQITDPATGVTKLAYDANNQLISVIDPRTLSTTYTRNGFGDLAKQVSPDTGTTANTFDSGGNLKTSTDARGAEATNAYDALNRVTQEAYSDETINFTYDAGTNGKGRLTGASDTNHSLSWTYDPLGRITGKGQTVGGITKSVGYSYTNGDLVKLVTPSGQTIAYGYTNHRITSITVNSTPLLTGVSYFPFGPVSGWTWGNASTVSRTYNTDGNVSQIATAGDLLTFGYDNALRINSLSDTLFSSSSYVAGYDALDRLNSLAQTGVTSNWTYDADGNHLTQTGTSTVTTTPSTSSNRLNSLSGSLVRTYAYDATGNTLSYTGASFGFNQRGRMSSATVGSTGASYIYNALGQLIEKTVAGVTTLLMYDEAGHLLGEYSSTGALIQETVWMDDTPVATLRPNGSAVTIYYVHTDHLNAPRVVTQSSSDNSIRWLWGGNAANQNPLGLGTFTYNLRFPGQYYQAETGLNYNYFRDYDPATGRYLESDPIGLAGGRNTYAYANENPLSQTDPSGLFTLALQVKEQLAWHITGGLDGNTNSRIWIKCSCSRTCDGNWKLDQCYGRLDVTVTLLYWNPLGRQAFRNQEQQHVDDYGAARSTIEAALTNQENLLKSTTYTDEKTCADSSRDALLPIANSWQMAVALLSAAHYDYHGGPHGH
jgi:RHS repeat-associated protein